MPQARPPPLPRPAPPPSGSQGLAGRGRAGGGAGRPSSPAAAVAQAALSSAGSQADRTSWSEQSATLSHHEARYRWECRRTSPGAPGGLRQPCCPLWGARGLWVVPLAHRSPDRHPSHGLVGVPYAPGSGLRLRQLGPSSKLETWSWQGHLVDAGLLGRAKLDSRRSVAPGPGAPAAPTGFLSRVPGAAGSADSSPWSAAPDGRLTAAQSLARRESGYIYPGLFGQRSGTDLAGPHKGPRGTCWPQSRCHLWQCQGQGRPELAWLTGLRAGRARVCSSLPGLWALW